MKNIFIGLKGLIRAFSIILLFSGLHINCFAQARVDSNRYFLVIDPNTLNTEEKLAYYVALKAVYKKMGIFEQEHIIQSAMYSKIEPDKSKKYSNQKAYNVSSKKDKELYKFIDTSFRKISFTLTEASIAGASYTIDYMPVIPKLPASKDVSNIQFIDLINKTAAYKSAATLLDKTNQNDFFVSSPQSDTSAKTSFSLTDKNYDGLWGLRLQNTYSDLFMKELRKSNTAILDKINVFEENVINVQIDNIDQVDTAYRNRSPSTPYIANSARLGSAISSELTAIPDSDFRNFFVIDQFSKTDNCLHGNKVRNVIDEVLRSVYKNETQFKQLQTKIINLPINYYDNRNEVDIKINQVLGFINNGDEAGYLKQIKGNSYLSNQYKIVQDYVNSLKNAKKPDFPLAMPSQLLNIYLQYCMLNKDSGDVINTSFIVKMPMTRIGVKLPNCKPLLVTAADNITGSIDVLYKQETDLLNTEPLISYYEAKDKAACFIIGGYKSKSDYFGMYSSTGDGITGIGHVNNWNDSNSSLCIKPSDIGNSFATSEIATYLWLAKAYWRYKKYAISNWDIKMKYLLSGDLNSIFIDKIASGGLLNFERFIYPSSKYVTDITGQNMPRSLTTTSYIKINGHKFFFKGKNENGSVLERNSEGCIYGLSIVDNKLYVFIKGELRWTRIDDNANMELSLVFNNGESYTELNNFSKIYHNLIYY